MTWMWDLPVLSPSEDDEWDCSDLASNIDLQDVATSSPCALEAPHAHGHASAGAEHGSACCAQDLFFLGLPTETPCLVPGGFAWGQDAPIALAGCGLTSSFDALSLAGKRDDADSPFSAASRVSTVCASPTHCDDFPGATSVHSSRASSARSSPSPSPPPSPVTMAVMRDAMHIISSISKGRSRGHHAKAGQRTRSPTRPSASRQALCPEGVRA